MPGDADLDESETMKCAICMGPLAGSLTHVADALTGEQFSICKCSHCGAGQTVPRPDDLGRYYAAYYGNRHGLTARYCIRRRLRLVRRSAGLGTGKCLLDIGCGDGSFLLASRAGGWNVAGTEIHPEPARQYGLDVRSEVEQFTEQDAFDCVTLWHSLEHLADPRRTLAQVRDLLRERGTLLIAVPDNGGWQARWFGRYWLHLDVPRHLHHFNQVSLERLLELSGFRSERYWHQELEYDLVGWSQSLLNAATRRPNLFFNVLTGKGADAGKAARLIHLGLGLALTAAAVPAVAVSTALRRGGTLIVAARRR